MPRKKPDADAPTQPAASSQAPPASAAARSARKSSASASASYTSSKSSASSVRPLRIGIGGPVGAGKTSLVTALCRTLRDELSLAVVSNDTCAREDADLLTEEGVLTEPGRFRAVHAGCSPQAAIRDDIAANLEAVEALEARFAPLDLVLIEGGGADLSAIFSRGLIDRQIFVIDTAAGGRTTRKGGSGITDTDLLLVNKTDLAPLVGADLEQMRVDAIARRAVAPGGVPRDTPLPTLFTSLAEHPHAPAVADWIRELITEHRASVSA